MTEPREPDFQPTLEGELVRLRPLRADDWEGMFAAAADPLIWELHPVRNRYQESFFRDFFDGGLASNATLAILDKRTGAIVGSSRYHGYDPELREVEIGWTFLARSHWGGTYNREIKRLMIAHAFGFVDTVIFMVGERNFRSQRAMEKIGAIRRPLLRDRAYHGETVRHVVFEIRRPSEGVWAPPGY